MTRSFRPLAYFRRRARVWLRALLPFVACGWLGAATPCPAMVAADADGAARETHETHETQTHETHKAHEPHETHATPAEHDAPPTHETHARCPHCLSTALSGEAHDGSAHAHCAALTDLSDGARHHSVVKWDAKQVVPLAAIAYAAPVSTRIRAIRKLDRDHRQPPAVALNLQFCVLLI